MEPPMKWMLPLAVSPRPARYGVAIGSAAISVVLVEFLLPFRGEPIPVPAALPRGDLCGLVRWFRARAAGNRPDGPGCRFLPFEPRFTFAIARPGDQLAISLFLVVGGFISWLGEMVLRANRRLEKYARGIANQRDISEKARRRAGPAQ